MKPLDQPASMPRLLALRRARVLHAHLWPDAIRLAQATASPELWRVSLDRLGLFVGTGLTLAGIAYFFAFNWSALTLEQRLVLVHVPLLVALLLGAWRGFGSLVGQVCLLSASVLFGLGQVVISQAYQTGADPWTLFAVYCVVTLPWALAARFAGSWLLWLVSAGIAIGTAWMQLVGDYPGWMLVALSTVPIGAWLACHAPALQRLGFSGAWLPRVASVAAVVLLLVPTVVNVFEYQAAGMCATLALMALGAGAWARSVLGKVDLFDLSALALAFVVWSAAVLGRVLIAEGDGGAFAAMFIGGVVVVEVAAIAHGLRRLARQVVGA